jgi:hypothetical protein
MLEELKKTGTNFKNFLSHLGQNKCFVAGYGLHSWWGILCWVSIFLINYERH